MNVVLVLSTVVVAVVAQDNDIASLLDSIGPSLGAAEQFFSQGPGDDRSDRTTFDFIVVGAGAAGSVMANRLSEMPHWNVLLLEAGGDETFAMDIPFLAGASPYIDWNYTMVPQSNGGCPAGPTERCTMTRAIVMGGSTVHNTMLFVRGNRRDYDTWAEMGNEGWDYESVLPYFKKMENVQIPELRDSPYHGTEGKIMNSRPYDSIFTNYALDAARLLGIPVVDYNGANQTGISPYQASYYQGARWSANRGYILGLKRPNLFVRKRSLVSKVIIKAGRAVGVEYIRDHTTCRAYATREVILSAGAINTPQLLMLSGVGPRDHLDELGIPVIKDLPVGRTLYDHTLFLGLVFQINSSIVPTREATLSNIYNFVEYFANRTGPLSLIRGAEVIRFFEIGDEAVNYSWPNMQSVVFTQPYIINPEFSRSLGFTDEFYEKFSVPLTTTNSFQVGIQANRPKSKGTLTLQDDNIYTQPIIDPNFFADEEDVTLKVEAIKEVIRLFTSGPFAGFGAEVYDTPLPACANFTFGSDEYWSCAVRWASVDGYHPSCTSKMGPENDSTAVVSPDLKVYGIRKLRVVDASIMPTIPTGNIQVPVYMIGEKAADFVKCEHLQGTYCPTLETED